MTGYKAKKARWQKCEAPQLLKKGKLVHQQATQRSGLSATNQEVGSQVTQLWKATGFAYEFHRTVASKDAAVPECGSRPRSYVPRARCTDSRPKLQVPSLFWKGFSWKLCILYLTVWLLICMHLGADCYPPLLEDIPAMQVNHTLYYIDKLKDKNHVIIPIAVEKKHLTKFNILLW